MRIAGDLFHEKVPEERIWRVIEAAWKAEEHTFQVLTKRSERMRKVLMRSMWWLNDTPRNIWLGVTAENQEAANDRIPHLLETPAVVRFVSCEPLLGPVDLRVIPYQGDTSYYLNVLRGTYTTNPGGGHGTSFNFGLAGLASLDWVICGGEFGPGARPMHPDWVRGLRDQCKGAGVPFFFKQWGAWMPMSEFVYVDEADDLPCDMVYPDGTLHSANGSRERANRVGLPTSTYRVGKKRAGRLLDGREWNQYPETRR
jgi:protein gp37